MQGVSVGGRGMSKQLIYISKKVRKCNDCLIDVKIHVVNFDWLKFVF